MAKSKVGFEDVVLYKAKKLAEKMRDRARKEVNKMKMAIEKEPDEIEQQKLIGRMIAYIEDVESEADRIVNLASPKPKKTKK
jgi:oligoendopeptidase F